VTSTSTAASYAYLHRVRLDALGPDGVLWPERLLIACHDAWESLLREVGRPIEAILAEGKYGFPIVHVEVDAPKPVRGPELHIAVSVALMPQAKSVRVSYFVADSSGEVLARAQTVHVAIDRSSHRAIAVPDDLREALSRFS
jgi:acyl-CoA thioesterase FadM